jgi:colanic acid biosynthesis glycosyl transferase WcaI
VRLLIFNLYFHPDPTGTGLTTGELARDLARRGHEVSVVTTVPHYGLDEVPPEFRRGWIQEERWEGVRVFRTKVPVTRKKTMLSRLASYLSYAGLGWIAGLRAPRPDVVMGLLPPITTGPTVWLVSLLRRAPLVLNVQDVYPDSIFRSRVLAWINRRLERFLLRRAARITALSSTQREMLVTLGADPARVTVIPMWTDLEGVHPERKENAFRAEHGGGASFIALYAGNLGAYSGVGVLLEAADRLRDDSRIRFLIVGRGHGRDALVGRAEELALPNVTFLPTQPRERLSEMLAASDVGLVTLDPRLSVGNVPSKTFTIMAAGRPVLAAVGSRNEIARVVAESGCGVVARPDSPEAIAEILRGWASDTSSLDAMGSRGRMWAEKHHDRVSAVREFEVLLDGALSRDSGHT